MGYSFRRKGEDYRCSHAAYHGKCSSDEHLVRRMLIRHPGSASTTMHGASDDSTGNWAPPPRVSYRPGVTTPITNPPLLVDAPFKSTTSLVPREYSLCPCAEPNPVFLVVAWSIDLIPCGTLGHASSSFVVFLPGPILPERREGLVPAVLARCAPHRPHGSHGESEGICEQLSAECVMLVAPSPAVMRASMRQCVDFCRALTMSSAHQTSDIRHQTTGSCSTEKGVTKHSLGI